MPTLFFILSYSLISNSGNFLNFKNSFSSLFLSVNDIFKDFSNSFIFGDWIKDVIFVSFNFNFFDILLSNTVSFIFIPSFEGFCSSLNKSFPIIPENSSQNDDEVVLFSSVICFSLLIIILFLILFSSLIIFLI